MKLPDQFRLPQPSFPSPQEFAAALAATGPSPESRPIDRGPDLTALSKALITIANQTWRLSVATHEADSHQPKAELTPQDIRRVVSAMEAIKETIDSLGIKIVDRTGEPFNPGLPEQVITEEPLPGISHEKVLRTLRPTILWHQSIAQRGEIDIAVPKA